MEIPGKLQFFKIQLKFFCLKIQLLYKERKIYPYKFDLS